MAHALAAGLLLTASVLWIEAHERRAVLAAARRSSRVRLGLKLGGWVLALLALVAAAQPQGLERGAPIWLGWFMTAGVAALLVMAFSPRLIPALGAAGLALAVVSGLAWLAGGP